MTAMMAHDPAAAPADTTTDDAATNAPCPAWCNAHEASNYPDVVAQEHCHRGEHRFDLPEGFVELTLTHYVSMFDVDGFTVKPVADEPYVSIHAESGDYASDFQGEVSVLVAIAAAVTAVTNGLGVAK